MEYLVPVNILHPKISFSTFRDSALSLFQLEHYVRRALSRHVMVILNGCSKGSALTIKTSAAKEPLTETPMSPVREFILVKKNSKDKSTTFEDLLISALEGKADLNKDGWLMGRELVSYLKRNLGKKDKFISGKLEVKGAMKGEFLFPLQPVGPNQPIRPQMTLFFFPEMHLGLLFKTHCLLFHLSYGQLPSPFLFSKA